MDEEQVTTEETVETPEMEEATPLADVHQMVTEAETAIQAGEKSKNEAIDELITSLQGMKEEAGEMMGGLVEDETFELPEEE